MEYDYMSSDDDHTTKQLNKITKKKQNYRNKNNIKTFSRLLNINLLREISLILRD